MLTRLLIGFTMMAVCVVVHAAGVAAALRRLRPTVQQARSFWRITGFLVLVAVWVVLLHLVEIAAWGVFYTLNGAMPDLQSAVYFSAVTYTTTGYGDMVLPPEWRLHGGIEALTGILMCGWSTGFFFAVVSQFHRSGEQA
jgi:hypothetical protein